MNENNDNLQSVHWRRFTSPNVHWRRFGSNYDAASDRWILNAEVYPYPNALEQQAKQWENTLNDLVLRQRSNIFASLTKKPVKGTLWQRISKKLKLIFRNILQSAHDQLLKTNLVYCTCDCE